MSTRYYRLSSIHNAYTTWDQKLKDSVELGKLANFVILSGGFMGVREEQIFQQDSSASRSPLA
jgi:urease alpha subunit